MLPLSPGATSSWITAASSLACSCPPPAPRVRVATPVLTSRTATSSTPSPQTPDAVFTPTCCGRTGKSTSGVVKCEGALAGSVAGWPLRGSEAHFTHCLSKIMIIESLINHAALNELQMNLGLCAVRCGGSYYWHRVWSSAYRTGLYAGLKSGPAQVQIWRLSWLTGQDGPSAHCSVCALGVKL